MTKKITLSLAFGLVFVFFVQGQTYRYTQTVFASSSKTSDVVYGNAPFLNSPYHDESATSLQNLVMDIYVPQGDTKTNRPAIIFAHGGGFSTGSRTVDDMTAFCDTFARKGYVTATIDYRQGVEVNDNGDLHYTRAAYRGVQDGRAAVRFLRANAATYGIDPDKIYWGGNSAGSFIGLNAIYMDEDEKPAYAAAVNYSIGLVPYSGPDLGNLDVGQNLSENGAPDAVMACWGGVGDTLTIETENNQAVFLIHGTADNIVPFNSGSPFNLSSVSPVYGSNSISTRLYSVNIPAAMTYFVEGENHEFYGVNNGNWENGSSGNAYWDTVVVKATQFYWQQHKPTAAFGFSTDCFTTSFTENGTGAVSYLWDFDDGETSTDQSPSHTFSATGQYRVRLYVENDNASWDTISHLVTIEDNTDPTISCIGDQNIDLETGENVYIVSVTEFDPVEATDNCGVESVENDFNNSSSLAGAEIPSGTTTIVWEITDKAGNKATCQFDVTVNLATGLESIEQNGISFYPNPTKGLFTIESNQLALKNIQITDLAGKIVFREKAQGQKQTFDLSAIENGVYFVRIETETRTFRAKIVKR